MVSLTFPKSSTPGARPGEGEGRLINAHLSREGDATYLRRAPGLVQEVSAGQVGPRGMGEIAGDLYAAYEGTVVRWSSSPVTLSGALAGSDNVTFAFNNKQPTADLVAVRENGGAYAINRSTNTIASYPDTDLPVATVNSVTNLSAYFIFTDPTTGRIWASQVNDTAQSSLSYASAEARPDRLVRGITHGSTFFAMGSASIEPWKDVGTSPFPLARHTTVIQAGLLTAGAVAGFQEGWDREPLFVAHDGTVRALRGYEAIPVSTPDVERFIAASTVSSLRAFVYTARGGSFWVLSSDQGTWEFNLATGSWSERSSDGATGWRARWSVKSGGHWYLGDTLSNSFLRLSPDAQDEAGEPLVFEVQSGALKDYPNRVAVPAVMLDYTLGVGDSTTPNPECEIAWSHNGGASWSPWVSRSLGAASQPKGPVRVNRLGLATHQGLRVKTRVSDPVEFSFMGGSVPDPSPRRGA